MTVTTLERAALVDEVAHMLWQWEVSGEELYSDFAERMVARITSSAKANT